MTMTPLSAIASARSGDKGEGSNVGIIAHSDAAYAFLREALTEDVVREVFSLDARVVEDPISHTPLIVPIGRYDATDH